ncbi:MAG TPA: ROK family protein [Kurthia gibsonii]|nr:ROK family protein [Kurthia gibsonii]
MRTAVADIGGTTIKVAIVNEEGVLTQYTEYDTESKKGGAYLVQKLITILKGFLPFEAIGISTAGQVDTKRGIITYANDNLPSYTGTKLQELLEKAFQVPVKIENDVNAAALGELHYGAGKEQTAFLCLTYGTGVGGAIIMDSKLYRGANGVAAEFGHIIVHPNGRNCNCGLKGCYEQYASTTALIRQVQAVDSSYQNGRQVFEALKQENKKIESVLSQWMDEIVLGLVSLIHCFNPSVIIVGGGVMEQSQVVEEITRRVRKQVIHSFSNVTIKQAVLGNRAGLLGAASLHIRHDG